MLLETQNTILQINTLPSGVYILYLQTENSSIGTRKIIKK